MLNPSSSLEEFHQRYVAIKARFAAEVAKIVTELEAPSRKRNVLFTGAKAVIDAAVRDYQMFLNQVNAARLKQESEAETHAKVLNVRREWGVLTTQVNLFRNETNRWSEINGLIEAQAKQPRQKLYPNEEKLPASVVAQLKASDDVFARLQKALNPVDQSDAAKEYGCFPDIGLSNSDFHLHMHAAYRLCLAMKRVDDVRFLDVGCGGGLKVFSAYRYFDHRAGFDFDPLYVTAAKNMLAATGTENSQVFVQDALTFEEYDKFDVIYFYRPMNDDALLQEMEQRITSMARPETVLIAPYGLFSRRYEGLGVGHVSGSVYLAQTSQRKADAWRRKAERTGVYVRKPEPPSIQSIWDPIVEASRANGYDLPYRHKKPRY